MIMFVFFKTGYVNFIIISLCGKVQTFFIHIVVSSGTWKSAPQIKHFFILYLYSSMPPAHCTARFLLSGFTEWFLNSQQGEAMLFTADADVTRRHTCSDFWGWWLFFIFLLTLRTRPTDGRTAQCDREERRLPLSSLR